MSEPNLEPSLEIYWTAPVLRLAKAISVAEGSPKEWNNPGSLTGTDAGAFPTCGTGNAEGVWKFVNERDGWQALCVKVHRMLVGKSSVYPPAMTIEEMGTRYSGSDDGNWGRNVAAFLGVPVTTTIQELAE